MATQLSRGINVYAFGNSDGTEANMPADNTSSSAFGMPRGEDDEPTDLQWWTTFDSSPTTFALVVEHSPDSSHWYYLDSTSDITGVSRAVRRVMSPYIRMRVIASTGGSKLAGGFRC